MSSIKNIIYNLCNCFVIFYLKIIGISYLNHIILKGKLKNCKFRIKGQGNTIEINKNSLLVKSHIIINGNNNKLIINENCFIGKNCKFLLEGENLKIEIQRNTTVTRDSEFCVQEKNNYIIIGEDCMLSNNVILRTSDSHPIYEITPHNNTLIKKRINEAKSIQIGNHVWIAPNSKIMKGAYIANNCIIGSDTTISHKYEKENCLIIGRPARIIKENVEWTRENLF